MKTRSQTRQKLIDDLRNSPKKSKFCAIEERKKKVRTRAEEKRADEKNKKQKRELRVILDRIKKDDVLVHRITINEIRKEKKKKSRRKMTEYVKPVEALKLDGNFHENWRKFKCNYDIFATAVGMEDGNKTDAVKINTFLNAMGPDAVEIYDTFKLSALERASYDSVTKAFADFCAAHKNEVYERFIFYHRDQKDGESFDSFLMDIKILVKSCEFGDATEVMLRDRIVMGIADKSMQTKLLGEKNLTYDLAVEKCRSSEATKEHQAKMCKTKDINELKGESAQSSYTRNSKNAKNNNNNKYKHSDKRANTWQGNAQYR